MFQQIKEQAYLCLGKLFLYYYFKALIERVFF
jgi:hypothetical protein